VDGPVRDKCGSATPAPTCRPRARVPRPAAARRDPRPTPVVTPRADPVVTPSPRRPTPGPSAGVPAPTPRDPRDPSPAGPDVTPGSSRRAVAAPAPCRS
jgi:hypothetical protein